jgi:hypothetical protein
VDSSQVGGDLVIADDLTIEVRDKTLKRVGILLPEDISLKAVVRHCGVGEWSLDLPTEHLMVPYLRTPGSGIIIHTRDDIFMSGPTTKPKFKASPEDPQGIMTFSGVDDNILLQDGLAWPLPSQADVTLQTVANDVRTGIAETVMKAYVSANIGPTAPLARRGSLAQLLTIQTDATRGPTVTKSPRFMVLGNLLTEIATYANLGYRIVQVGSTLEFQVYSVTDRTQFIRFDIENATLEDEEVEVSAPTVTRPIVAGQQEGADRTIIQRTNSASLAAETDWGRKIEVFIDQRQTDDPAELQQAGDTALLEGGFTAVAVKAVPTDDDTREYNVDWRLGDKVVVVVFDQETPNTVTEVSLVASKDGVALGAALGDVTGFQLASSMGGQVDDLTRRVESIEKNQ